MSRLEKHRRKQIILYTTILFVLIVFFFLFGLPFFISSSVFISNLFRGNKESTTTKTQTFRDIQISDIPEATNSASFVVAGTVSNFDTIEFYLNGKMVKNKDEKGESSFSEEISGLQSGDNRFYLIGKTEESSDNKQTSTYTIVYKNNKPKLEITEPADNLKTNHTEIKVAGNTDKDAEIKVNGIPVIVDTNGYFQTQIKLNNGDNKIVIAAEDSAGNREEKILTVNYSTDN